MSIDDKDEDGAVSYLSDQEVSLQPDWKKAPTLTQLKADLEQGQPHQIAIKEDLARWRKAFEAAPLSGDKTNKSKIVPKLIRKQAEWRYASLSEPFLSAENLFNVSPTTWNDRRRAIQTGLLLNFQFTVQLDLVTLIDRSVRRLTNDGTLVLRTGWLSTKEKYKKKVTAYSYRPANQYEAQALDQQFQQQLVPVLNNPDSYNELDETLRKSYEASMQYQQPTVAIPGEVTEVEAERYKVNRPTIDVIPAENLLVDPTCEGIFDKAQFVIYSYEASMADLKKDDRYKNVDKINPSTAIPEVDRFNSQKTQTFKFADEARAKLIVYEYWGMWDINGTGITEPIVATWCGNTMIRLEKNPFPDGKPPFIIVPFMPRQDSVYGEPDAELLEDNQRIQGAALRGVLDVLGKTAVGQRGTAKGFLDTGNRRKFQNGEDYEFNPNQSPATGIFDHDFPPLPVSAMNLIDWSEGSAEALTGVKAFSTGGGLTGDSLGKTATAVRSVTDATTKRDMGILRRLSNGLLDAARKIVAMNAEFLEEDQIIRITDEQFVKVRVDDLGAEYDLKLNISTPEADNAKAQEMAMMLQTLGNSVDFGVTQMLLTDIAMLRQMPALAHKIEAYQPQPDPNAALQGELLKAQIALANAQAQEAQARAGLAGAKVEKVGADTDKVHADVNNKALDFHERATGADHAKEIDKLNTQAETQLALKQADNEGKVTNTALSSLLAPKPVQ